MAQELIDAYEDDEEHKDLLSDLVVEPPAPPDPGEAAGHEEEPVSGDTAKADALRIRELEIVGALAADSLRAAGDEATAEIVRAVIEKRPEQTYSL